MKTIWPPFHGNLVPKYNKQRTILNYQQILVVELLNVARDYYPQVYMYPPLLSS